jgi:hypothetical protein
MAKSDILFLIYNKVGPLSEKPESGRAEEAGLANKK